jgi:hypothetical protein
MSEGGELVHFHDWRAARDRKAATRRLWRSRCSELVTVAVSIGLGPIGVVELGFFGLSPLRRAQDKTRPRSRERGSQPLSWRYRSTRFQPTRIGRRTVPWLLPKEESRRPDDPSATDRARAIGHSARA